MPVVFDTDEIAKVQQEDSELKQLLQSDSSSVLRRRVFNLVHGLSHPRARATSQQIRKKFVWPEGFKVPDQTFEQIHIDIVGPLPVSQGFKYCLTMVDRFSRWPEAIPMVEASAETVASTFYTNWIARFGAPSSN